MKQNEIKTITLPEDLSFARDDDNCLTCKWMNGESGGKIYCDYYKGYYNVCYCDHFCRNW